MTTHEQVLEFHTTFGAPVGLTPALISPERAELRYELIKEELKELRDAIDADDLVEIADALGDLDYVVHGAAIEYGLPHALIVTEIHASNMSKLGEDGLPILREDGKILKGPGYYRPNIAPILEKNNA
jgi:Uncharacterized protein conserved in bacteria